MSKLNLKTVLEIIDKASKPIRDIQKNSKGLSGQFKDQQATLKKLNQTQGDITSFKRLSDALGKTRNEMQQARERAAQLAQAHAAMPKPTRAMTKELERARLAVNQLKQEERDQVQHLQRLRQSLSQAGISTKNLSKDEQQLKVKIDSATTALRRKKEMLDRVSQSQKRYAKDLERINKLRGMGMNMGMQAVAGGAAMLVPIKLSVDFESAMADVKKVVDFDTPQQFKKMNDDVIQLSKNLPMAAKDIAVIVAAGGQSGIEKSELLQFADDAVKMGVAFDITADHAGRSMAEMRAAFKMTQAQVVTLTDKINYLGNTNTVEAPKIMEVVQRIGSLGKVGGLASSSIAAMSASLVALEPDIAATGIKNVILRLTQGEAATKSMKAAYNELGTNAVTVSKDMQKNADQTIINILKSISKLDTHKQASIANQLFGTESITSVMQLVDNMSLYEKNLQAVGDKSKYAGSMQAEYAARAATTANNFQLFKNRLSAAGITIGNTLLPTINETLEKVGKLVDRFQSFAAQHPVLVSNISKAAMVIIGLLAVLSALSLALVTLLGPMALLRMTFGVLGAKGFGLIAMLSKVGSALKYLLIIARAHPIIALITTLAILAYTVYKNWEPIKQFFADIWENIKTFFSSGIANITATIINWSPLGLFYQAFAGVMNYFGFQLPSTFTGFGQMLMQGLGNGIMNSVSAVVDKAKAAAAKVTSTVKGAFGIHSPSRVFAQLGAYNMQGLAMGIDQNANLPSLAISNISKDLLGSFDTSAIRFDRRPPISSHLSPTSAANSQPMQLTINIHPSAGMDERSLAQMVAAEVAKFQRVPSSNPRSYNDID